MTVHAHVFKGLEGVYVIDSAICLIDTENGVLYYAGYEVKELVEKSSFEEVAFLLLHQRLPTKSEFKEFSGRLRESLDLESRHIETIRRHASATDTLTMLATLMVLEGSGKKGGNPSDVEAAINAIAKMGSFFSTIIRIRSGGDYVPPRKDLSFAENILYMMKGGAYRKEHADILDDLLILHAEHGVPASTFASIVTASTLSDLYSSIAAGTLALKGPLHGGASEASYEQALSIGSVEKVPQWVESTLAQKKKIMGFGHRVYKIYDPRATVVKEMIARHANIMDGEVRKLYEITQALEDYGLKFLASRGIYPNVDLWTPILYRMVGMPPDSFTAFFAVSRTAGWASHILEYWRDNKLIRPLHLYVGESPRKYLPMELRGES
ncbi:MAG: citrate/2-methylcitrate synthase [Nitrososphaerota archaeon]